MRPPSVAKLMCGAKGTFGGREAMPETTEARADMLLATRKTHVSMSCILFCRQRAALASAVIDTRRTRGQDEPAERCSE